jgi:choline dehydrogenase-like flavoprotein
VDKSSTEVIVVGSGPGGASVAAELARRGVAVTILEWGERRPLRGSFIDMARIAAIPGRGAFPSISGSTLFRGIGIGGTSQINYATAYPPPFERFEALGIDLAADYAAIRAAIPCAPVPDRLVGPMASRIESAARSIGLPWQRLDKMIDPATCRPGCWRCTYGCPYGAKWTARHLVDHSVTDGAVLRDGCRVTRVLRDGNRATGVEFTDAEKGGRIDRLHADAVVLAAGGIGSPRLLATAGVAARNTLFVDPVVAMIGIADDIAGGAELPMVGGMRTADGLMLSDMTLPPALYRAFAIQAGRIGKAFAHSRALTLMLKVPDTPGGRLGPRWVDKPIDVADREGFRRGEKIARELLGAAGAREVFASRPFAAHPGGSCPVGEVVDTNLETTVRGLYVSDASLLPAPWGLPPTMTLLCLGRRLGAHLGANAGHATSPAPR